MNTDSKCYMSHVYKLSRVPSGHHPVARRREKKLEKKYVERKRDSPEDFPAIVIPA